MTTRRSFLQSLAALPALRAAAQTGKMNVLFMVSDDMNNDLGCYGHPVVKSPHLDRLASRGVIFDNAYCQFPVCQPSRASFLSGRRPETTRVWTLKTPTRAHMEDVVFLPQHFRNNGYFTVMSGKIYHTGDHSEDPRSWDVEHREFGKKPPEDSLIKYVEAAGPSEHTFNLGVMKTPDAETPDGIVARRGVEYMEKCVREGKSFFLGAGFRRPHAPYAVPKKYFDMYPPNEIPLPDTPLSHFDKLLPAAVAYKPPEIPMDKWTVREFMSAYYACNSYVDAQVGVLLNAMDRLNLWKNTVVMFIGDHGYHIHDHGGLWHKLTLFEQSARAPMMLYAPGQAGNGERCGGLVEFVDLYPTLADLCGLPDPEGIEGTSFKPLLASPEREWKRAAFTMVCRDDYTDGMTEEPTYFGKSVRTPQWRYTEWDEGRKGIELYDHETDPNELNNIAEKPGNAPVVKELRELLRQGWKAALPPDMSSGG